MPHETLKTFETQRVSGKVPDIGITRGSTAGGSAELCPDVRSEPLGLSQDDHFING